MSAKKLGIREPGELSEDSTTEEGRGTSFTSQNFAYSCVFPFICLPILFIHKTRDKKNLIKAGNKFTHNCFARSEQHSQKVSSSILSAAAVLDKNLAQQQKQNGKFHPEIALFFRSISAQTHSAMGLI